MTDENKIYVDRDYFMRFILHNSYLDVKKATPVGEDEIQIEWVGALVAPTTIKVTSDD